MAEPSSIALPVADAAQARAPRKDPASHIAGVHTREQARKVALEFEKMFVSEMLGPAFSTIPTDGPFGGGAAESMFRPMLIDRYAEAAVKQGGFGVADAVMKEILKLQGLE